MRRLPIWGRLCPTWQRGVNDMGAFYGWKILNGEINPKTGTAWELENVPVYWRGMAGRWIEGENYHEKN